MENKDTELWQAFKKGDRDAFAQLYTLHISDLLSYGYRVTSDRQLIRDSIQDIFLNLWQSRSNLSDTNSIRFYLYRSLRNKIIRNTEKSKHTIIDSTNLLDNIIGAFSIEDDLISIEQYSEDLIRLKCAIEELPKRQQEIIQLRYYHNFSFEEIAEMMQIKNQSVRNLLQKAINELRHYFTLILWFLSPFLV